MLNPPIEAIWQQYYDEMRMNCKVVNDHGQETEVPIAPEAESALRFMFDNSITVLIEKDGVQWDSDPGENGIARRFILSMAAAVGLFASKLTGGNRPIDRRDIEAAFFALEKDWEKVCPLPIIKARGRQSCPIPPTTKRLRDLRHLEAVHA